MAIDIFIKLQTPVIELPVTAKDAAGKQDKITVGFKRYEVKEGFAKLKELENYQKEVYLNNKVELKEQYRYLNGNVEEAELTSSETPSMTEAEATDRIVNFIKDEIAYIKDITVIIQENNVSKDLKIADTRTAKPIEPLWGTPEECLSVLVDSFLACAPFRGSLIDAQQKALTNTNYKDAEIKN